MADGGTSSEIFRKKGPIDASAGVAVGRNEVHAIIMALGKTSEIGESGVQAEVYGACGFKPVNEGELGDDLVIDKTGATIATKAVLAEKVTLPGTVTYTVEKMDLTGFASDATKKALGKYFYSRGLSGSGAVGDWLDSDKASNRAKGYFKSSEALTIARGLAQQYEEKVVVGQRMVEAFNLGVAEATKLAESGRGVNSNPALIWAALALAGESYDVMKAAKDMTPAVFGKMRDSLLPWNSGILEADTAKPPTSSQRLIKDLADRGVDVGTVFDDAYSKLDALGKKLFKS